MHSNINNIHTKVKLVLNLDIDLCIQNGMIEEKKMFFDAHELTFFIPPNTSLLLAKRKKLFFLHPF